MDLRERAKNLIITNYESTGKQYVAPDMFHKDQWFWDSCFHAIVCAELGLKDIAKQEIERMVKWQKTDGFIPHQVYKTKRRRFLDIERSLYKKDWRDFHSTLANPPVLAQAVEAINDPAWTQMILQHLVDFYLYFSQKRDPDGDNLISIYHPCESGRDSDPTFNFFRPHLESKYLNWLDQALFYLSLYELELKYRKLNWDIDKIWQLNLFNVEDVMFNCIWIDGLRSLYRLLAAYGHEKISFKTMHLRELTDYIKNLADNAEESLLSLMWDEKDKIFYALDDQNQKIKRATISSLFPLILDNTSPEQCQAIVSRLTNKDEFWTPHPPSSISQTDPAFDPTGGFYCNWKGPLWINMAWFILKGLVKHQYYDLAKQLADKVSATVEKQGFREFYSPFTGRGLRSRQTKNFGWSTLVVTFPKILESKNPA